MTKSTLAKTLLILMAMQLHSACSLASLPVQSGTGKPARLVGSIKTQAGLNPAVTRIRLENSSQQTRPNEQGKFSFEALATANGFLQAEQSSDDGTHYSARVPIQSPTGELDLKDILLKPSGSVYGQVKIANETDLIGINVFIGGTPIGSLTDQEGNYFLAGLAEGDYLITARKEGYQLAQSKVSIKSGVATPLQFQLEKRQPSNPDVATVSGRILSSQKPVAGASIRLEGESNATLSGIDGSYRLSGLDPQREYRVVVSHDGFSTYSQTIRLQSRQVQTLDIDLEAESNDVAGSIHGVVKDSQDQVVAGAQIETFPYTQVVISNEQGQFEMKNVLPGNYYLLARVDGQVKASRFIGLDPGQDIHLQLKGLASDAQPVSACDQQNINNVNINIPGAEVTVTINNQNTCTIKSTDR